MLLLGAWRFSSSFFFLDSMLSETSFTDAKISIELLDKLAQQYTVIDNEFTRQSPFAAPIDVWCGDLSLRVCNLHPAPETIIAAIVLLSRYSQLTGTPPNTSTLPLLLLTALRVAAHQFDDPNLTCQRVLAVLAGVPEHQLEAAEVAFRKALHFEVHVPMDEAGYVAQEMLAAASLDELTSQCSRVAAFLRLPPPWPSGAGRVAFSPATRDPKRRQWLIDQLRQVNRYTTGNRRVNGGLSS